MEERPHDPRDQDNLDLETPRKKRRGADFLSQYLLRRNGESSDNAESESDESSEKPKKFRRFFKGLFKNIVEGPREVLERPESSKRMSAESLFGIVLGSEENTPEKPEKQEDTDTAKEVSTIDHTQAQPNEPATSISNGRQPWRQFEPVIPDLHIAESQPQSPVTERTNLQPVAQERQSQPFSSTEREVIIDRRPNVALPVALVGLEYLARKKADRKLETKMTQRLTESNKEVQRTTQVNRELEVLVKQNREQLDSLKQERGIEVPRQAARPQVEKRAESHERVTQAPHRVEQPTPEKQRPLQEKAKAIEKLERELKEATPDTAITDRSLSRKHEVKDSQGARSNSSTVSIGSVLAGATGAQQSGMSVTNTTSASGAGDGLPIAQDDSAGSLYAQAMKSGFWAAMIIIILGIIAYLLK